MNNILNDAIKNSIDNAATPEWSNPQSLTEKLDPKPYPLDALPSVIQNAVQEVQGFVKAPVALVASSALSVLSIVGQAHVDVKRADQLTGPTSLFLLTIADSGERKSTCDTFFSNPIRDYEKEQAELAKPLIKQYKASMQAWEAKYNGVKEKIKSFTRTDKNTETLENALHDLEQKKPEPVRIQRLIYVDATQEALAYELASNWPSAALFSAEAGSILGAHAIRKDSVMMNLSAYNTYWDGGVLHVDRRTTESFCVNDVRLTIGFQVQQAALSSFLDHSGALARGIGFFARFLISWPESTQGNRKFTEAPKDWPALSAFHRRIRELLNTSIPLTETGTLSPSLLSMSIEAQKAWVLFYDCIEQELNSGGDFYDVRDVASKIADNAARLAALFHLFGGKGGDIELNAIESAIQIAAWHLNESKRFFGELALPNEMANAIRLDRWLVNYCRRNGSNVISRRELQRNVTPVNLRQQQNLDNALMELIEADRILVSLEGRCKNIYLNPSLLKENNK